MSPKGSRAVLRGLGRSNAPWLPGEIERLADAGDCWLPFALPLTPDQPLGEIHALTQQIRFFADEPQQHNLAVSLCPP